LVLSETRQKTEDTVKSYQSPNYSWALIRNVKTSSTDLDPTRHNATFPRPLEDQVDGKSEDIIDEGEGLQGRQRRLNPEALHAAKKKRCELGNSEKHKLFEQFEFSMFSRQLFI
jgi:hypothetical protein